MKRYWILWTYIGNYSESPHMVEAKSPEDAIDKAVGFYSDDFHKKARVYVFDRAPMFTRMPAPKGK